MTISNYFTQICKEVDSLLDSIIPEENTYPPDIHKSMRYSVFAGGKRLRPMLTVAVCDALKGDRHQAMTLAAALELIHTYTLIHDDLPALDNDDLRRGLPTNHIQFNESTAILTGDALLTLAFEVLADRLPKTGTDIKDILIITAETAIAIGSTGTIGGQMVDIEMEGSGPNIAAVEYIHTHKTGELIVACVRGAARLGGATKNQLESMTSYGKQIGLAFQIIDDILDLEGDEITLGKKLKSDVNKAKLTYPAIAGVKQSKEQACSLVDGSIEALSIFGTSADHLRDLAKYTLTRTF
ncbi:MAG TPA: farnesyl diphosphate synthase [Nitrospinota bacterium]|nr:farnesyl diphosphate synthase [Nitrospinota bacterium]|tara:strand:+ start:198273 stop:199163 length:891 start_codon:yes stop_codon:yes gene_type:complete